MTARFASCTRTALKALPDFHTDPRRACAPQNVQHLFTSDSKADINRAKVICLRRCPFRDQCLNWALAEGERWHVWGGVNMASDYERDQARRGQACLDDQVHDMWTTGHSDRRIADTLGVDPATIRASRKRQNLPALYGPGGYPLTEVAA